MTLRPALLVLAVLAAPAALADEPLMDRFDGKALEKLITAMPDYKVLDNAIDAAGKPTMTVEFGDFAFQVEGEFCEGEGKAQVCTGLQMSAILGDQGDADLDAVATKFNKGARAAKVFRIDAGLVLERYLILDHGVSPLNVKANIESFAEILGLLWKDVKG